MADALTSITGLSSGIDSKALVEQIMLLERRPAVRLEVGSSRVDLQACKLEYSIVSPK